MEWHSRVVDVLMRFQHVTRDRAQPDFHHDLARLSSLSFTSLVFHVVQPRTRLEALPALADRPFPKDHIAEDLLANPDLLR